MVVRGISSNAAIGFQDCRSDFNAICNGLAVHSNQHDAREAFGLSAACKVQVTLCQGLWLNGVGEGCLYWSFAFHSEGGPRHIESLGIEGFWGP